MLIDLAFIDSKEQTKTLYIYFGLWLTIIINLVK
jgi:hypothetical protein